MSADLSLKIDTPAESIEALAKEAEALKTKLEEERQKLNDVARELLPAIFSSLSHSPKPEQCWNVDTFTPKTIYIKCNEMVLYCYHESSMKKRPCERDPV